MPVRRAEMVGTGRVPPPSTASNLYARTCQSVSQPAVRPSRPPQIKLYRGTNERTLVEEPDAAGCGSCTNYEPCVLVGICTGHGLRAGRSVTLVELLSIALGKSLLLARSNISAGNSLSVPQLTAARCRYPIFPTY